jgi:hypothetical protein
MCDVVAIGGDGLRGNIVSLLLFARPESGGQSCWAPLEPCSPTLSSSFTPIFRVSRCERFSGCMVLCQTADQRSPAPGRWIAAHAFDFGIGLTVAGIGGYRSARLRQATAATKEGLSPSCISTGQVGGAVTIGLGALRRCFNQRKKLMITARLNGPERSFKNWHDDIRCALAQLANILASAT